MSSPQFRAIVLSTLQAQWSATVFFDASEYTDLNAIPVSDEPWLLVRFMDERESLATIATDGVHGWSASGTFAFDLFFPTGEASARALSLGEQLRALFRGRRFGSYIIDALNPFTDAFGAASRIGKWHGWTALGSYYNVICNGP